MPNELYIVIILISLLILVILVFSFNRYLRGGEYALTTVYDGDRKYTANYTPSQITWLKYSNEQRMYITLQCYMNVMTLDRERIYIKYMNDTMNTISENASFVLNGNRYYFNRMNVMSFTSDAHMDLIGILLHRTSPIRITRGFAVCEWHGDLYTNESNEFITTYESYNEHSIRLSRNEDEFINSFRDRQIRIYIEFSYGDGERVMDHYKPIHEMTHSLVNQILDLVKNYRTRTIIAIRLDLNSKSEYNLDELLERFERDNYSVLCFDECSYSEVNIPSTTIDNGFSYDEQITLESIINDDIKTIDIQVEHSEGGRNHKSNMVEFIARNIRDVVHSSNEIRDCFKSVTSYRFNQDGKFIYNISSKVNDLKNTCLVNSFGRFANDLFYL